MKIRMLIALMLLLCGVNAHAQTAVRIHQKDGTHVDVPIEQVDSITFVDVAPEVTEAKLEGSWLWGSVEAGYYELLTFNDDYTYIGYDNYFTYGFDTMTYGWYSQLGAMLTLRSNGYGYQRRYTWYVTGLSGNALEVMTRMGSFRYYRLQPESISLRVNDEPLECEQDDSFVFADGVVAAIRDHKLYGIAKGVTYVQKYIAALDQIVAYKVVVE